MYSSFDLSVKNSSHPILTRMNALAALASHLKHQAEAGNLSEHWTRAFARGALRLNETHNVDITPLDILVHAQSQPQQSIYTIPLNLIDPPQAREPPGVDANTIVCMNYLRGLTGDRSISPYFNH